MPRRVFPAPFAPINKILWLDVSSVVLPSAFGRMSLYFDCSGIELSRCGVEGITSGYMFLQSYTLFIAHDDGCKSLA